MLLCEMMAVPKFTHNYKATRDGVDAVDAGSDLYTPPSSRPAPSPSLPAPPAVYAYDLCQCTGGRAGRQAIVGVAWRPVTFARKKTNKPRNKTKAASPSSQAKQAG